MNLPEGLKYTKEHEWVKIDGDIATVGITDFAQQQLTDIVFVELPEKGKRVEQSKQAAVVESVKSVSDIFAPLSGEVTEVNSSIVDTPEKLNKDPYGEGWLFKIKITDRSKIDNLLSAKEYEEFVKSEAH